MNVVEYGYKYIGEKYDETNKFAVSELWSEAF